MSQDNKTLDKFYKKEVLYVLNAMKDLTNANKIPLNSVVGLAELIDSWKHVKKELQAEEEHKIRAKGSRADRRSGKSVKLEGKVSKSKAKTKEVRSSKKMVAIRKRSRS